MEKRKWLWKRKSGEKSPGETENSESISSHSERNSDDQEHFKVSPNHAIQSPEVTSKAMDFSCVKQEHFKVSPNHAIQSPEVTSKAMDFSCVKQEHFKASPNHAIQSPEVTSKAMDSSEDIDDSTRKLREKLSAALVNVSAKDDLVKQHAKVAEEAVAGWEKAENEVEALKQQVEEAAQRNSALEDRLSHVDGALKECVRQLRQVKEEQEQKIAEALLKTQAASVSTSTSHVDSDLCLKLESLERENSALKLEIESQYEEIEIRTIERDLSIEAAETASKQHLESIKKVAKLEAECRRLKIMACKSSSSSMHDHKSIVASSIYVDTITDCQSDGGDQRSCSDSGYLAQIADLDQFKNEKAVNRSITASSVEIDLMDDFLEMERLAALPMSGNKSSSKESCLRAELEAMTQRVATLEEKLQKVEAEKAELEDMAYRNADLEEKLQNVEAEKAELEAVAYRVSELEESLQRVEAEKAELEAMAYRVSDLEESLQRVEAEKAELEAMTYQVSELEESLQIVAAEKAELEAMAYRVSELEESLRNVEAEKAELDIAQTKSQGSVEALQLKLTEAEMKLEELQREVRLVNELRQSIESQLMGMEDESRAMSAKVETLETELRKERAFSEENTWKCRRLEEELTRKQQESILNSYGERKMKEDELAVAAGKLAECQKTIASLGDQLKSLATLEDFLIDTASLPGISGRESLASGDNGEWRLHCNETFSPKRGSDASRTASENSRNDKILPPSLSSPSSAPPSSQVCYEKNRNGFAKFFTRSKSGIHLEI